MDAFISRKRRRVSPPSEVGPTQPASPFGDVEESTDGKLAILSSLHSEYSHDDLLEVLLGCEGSVEAALEALSSGAGHGLLLRRKQSTSIGVQTSLSYLTGAPESQTSPKRPKTLTKKGKTLHLYDPADIAAHTPCSIIHNFLAPELATALLHELLPEVPTYQSATFKLFDNVVKSPHTACFYVNDLAERQRQRTEYLYNGSNLEDVRAILPEMRKVSDLVEEAVNQEIQKRIKEHYPDGKKLKYQCPARWKPNAAFVNCYDTGKQSVGYHSDQLSYLGPRAIIGSLSLGVAREFRVRKIVPREEDDKGEAADASGQISIHLPHNSLLVMHAEMQEEWKHSIAPALSIDPHPVAGNKRINITYRWYRESFHPKFTPKCKCGVPTVLKTVQRQKANRGRYMWMCQVGGQPGRGDGCGFFVWAEFTDDGEPIWNHKGSASDSPPKASPG
jgi:alkylated DNA repair dioxygenase AlkB